MKSMIGFMHVTQVDDNTNWSVHCSRGLNPCEVQEQLSKNPLQDGNLNGETIIQTKRKKKSFAYVKQIF
jgi:hypothetical protein